MRPAVCSLLYGLWRMLRKAQQYEVLTFEQDDEVESIRKSFFADKAFVERTRAALTSSEDWITLEELRAEVGE